MFYKEGKDGRQVRKEKCFWKDEQVNCPSGGRPCWSEETAGVVAVKWKCTCSGMARRPFELQQTRARGSIQGVVTGEVTGDEEAQSKCHRRPWKQL